MTGCGHEAAISALGKTTILKKVDESARDKRERFSVIWWAVARATVER